LKEETTRLTAHRCLPGQGNIHFVWAMTAD